MYIFQTICYKLVKIFLDVFVKQLNKIYKVICHPLQGEARILLMYVNFCIFHAYFKMLM